MEKNRKSQFLSGMKAGVPVIFGFIPVGIAYAIMARQAGFSVLHTCLMSLTVFAGASEIMAVGMYAQGAGIIAVILATFILNFRHIIMSTCVFERMKPTGILLKLLSAFGVTDESFAIFTTENKEKCTVTYLLGLILVNYSSWNIGTLIGALGAEFLPRIITASFGIALYALFIALLVPNLRGNFKLCGLVVLTAAVNSFLSLFLDSSWALIISTLICAFLGVFFVDLDNNKGEEDERD